MAHGKPRASHTHSNSGTFNTMRNNNNKKILDCEFLYVLWLCSREGDVAAASWTDAEGSRWVGRWLRWREFHSDTEERLFMDHKRPQNLLLFHSLRNTTSVSLFQYKLKTHLFKQNNPSHLINCNAFIYSSLLIHLFLNVFYCCVLFVILGLAFWTYTVSVRRPWVSWKAP